MSDKSFPTWRRLLQSPHKQWCPTTFVRWRTGKTDQSWRGGSNGVFCELDLWVAFLVLIYIMNCVGTMLHAPIVKFGWCLLSSVHCGWTLVTVMQQHTWFWGGPWHKQGTTSMHSLAPFIWDLCWCKFRMYQPNSLPWRLWEFKSNMLLDRMKRPSKYLSTWSCMALWGAITIFIGMPLPSSPCQHCNEGHGRRTTNISIYDSCGSVRSPDLYVLCCLDLLRRRSFLVSYVFSTVQLLLSLQPACYWLKLGTSVTS